MSDNSLHKIETDEKKRIRRSRKDGHERTYVCSQCQKSYLSNAALYTHTKTKHQNQGQKDYHRDQAEERHPIRGTELSPNSQLLGQNNSHNNNSGHEHASSNLQQLRNYMKRYFPERNKHSSVRLLSEGLPQHISEYIVPLMHYWEDKLEQPIDRSRLNIDEVISYFLSLVNVKVSSTCMNFLIRIFYYVREGLKIEHRRNLYCENQSAANLPNDFNNLIMNRRIPPENVEEDELMNNSTIICRVLEEFGHWLYDERFTDYKIIAKYAFD